jgi:competence protein ComEC
MHTSLLSRLPALRLLIPFMAGIIGDRIWHCWWLPVAFLVIACIGYMSIQRASSCSPASRLLWRPFFVFPLALAALSLGWLAAYIHSPQHLTMQQRHDRTLMGRVVDLDYTDFSMRLTVHVLDNDLPSCRVLLSTRGCDYTMQPGNLVMWPVELDEVGNMGNPDEMDYASYLLDSKGIRYEQHLPVSQVKTVGHSPTLITRMAMLRRDLQLKVFNSNLSPSAQHFVVALLLGNSDFIDKTTRQEFSAAGVAHVLALSGLHVGFIAMIIWWFLFPLDYLRLKKLRLIITLAAIVLFAVFTGMSPSVVRATVMIGFVFVSLIFHRRSVSLNALAMAALLILVFSPSALYHVGFQLSFITVGAVLLFARVPQILQSCHQWVNYLTATVITSLVAMLATVALTAHYFHTISLMSVLANLLILPILPIFMVLGALFLLVTAAGMCWPVLDTVLDAVCHYIHWAAGAVNAIPGSHVSGVYVSTFGVIAWFAVMILVVLWLYRHKARYLLSAAGALAILMAHSLWVDARTPRQGLVIFNSFDATPVFYYQNGKGYVWTPDNEDTDSADFARYHAGFLARHRITELQFVAGEDTLHLDGGFIKPPFAHLMGRRMVAVGRGKWKSLQASHHLELDDIIATKRFHGTAAKLQELYGFERLIISGAMHETAKLLQECDSLAIPVHDLASQGAVIYPDSKP